MVKYILPLLVLISIQASAYTDNDFDGVEDAIDLCPKSLITDLVDINGCTAAKNLSSKHHFDIIVGTSYSQTNSDKKTTAKNQSIQLDYYYKNLSFQVSNSYYINESDSIIEKGIGDTFLYAGYQVTVRKLSISFGAGAGLPTYKTELNNNKTDYFGSFALSYRLRDANLFGSYSRTITGDTDVKDVVSYKDSNAFSYGIGYSISPEMYVSASYSLVGSSYVGENDNMKTATAYMVYNLGSNWFASLSYAKGLNDNATDHYGDASLGYYF